MINVTDNFHAAQMKDVKEGGGIKFANLIGKNVGLVSGSQWEDCNDEAKAEAKAKSFKKGRKDFFSKTVEWRRTKCFLLRI